MAGINGFDISKYDIGGTQKGDKAGDKKLTGDEARKARADGWTVWDGFVEGDKVEHVENKDNKSTFMQSLKTFFNMRQSDSYKKFSERKEAILEQKMAEHGIYPTKVNGKKVWDESSKVYEQAEKEADIQARKELGLSETTFDTSVKVKSKSDDKTENTKDGRNKISKIEGINAETLKKIASDIKYTNEVDKIFSQILKDKYSIDTTGKELEELKKLREQYKEDFEAAKAQAKEKLGLKNPKYLESEKVSAEENQQLDKEEIPIIAAPSSPKTSGTRTSGTKRTAGTRKASGTKKTTGSKKASNTYQKTACPTIFKKGNKYYRKLNNGGYKEIIVYPSDGHKERGVTSFKITKVNKDGSYVAISNKTKNGTVYKEYLDNKGNNIKRVEYKNGKVASVHDGDNGAGCFGRKTYYDENGKPIKTEYNKKGDKNGNIAKVRNHRTGQWEKP